LSETPDPGRPESTLNNAGIRVLNLTLLLVPLVYLSGYYRGMHYPKLITLQVSVCALAVCCIAARSVWVSRRSSFLYPIALLLLLTSLQALRSLNVSDALITLTTQVSFGLLAVSVVFLVPPGREFTLVRFSALGGLIVGLLGVSEQLGLWLPPSSGRPGATFGYRNIAAMYLAANLPLSILLSQRRSRSDFILGAMATTCMVAFLVMTRSRGAWLGVAVASAIAILVMSRVHGEDGRSLARNAWHSTTVMRRWLIPGCLLVALALGSIRPRFEDVSLHRLDEKKTGVTTTLSSVWNPGGDRGRFRIWEHTLELIRDHPLTGVGLGNWSAYYPLFDAGDGLVIESAPKRPHNDLLWIWAELGPVGLLFYLWFVVLVFRRMFQQLDTGANEDRLMRIWLAAGALSLFIQSLFSFPREQAAGSMIFWLAAALVVRGTPCRASEGVCRAIRSGAVVSLIVGLGGVWLLAGALTFDRHYHQALAAQQEGRIHTQLEESRKAITAGTFDHRVFLQEAGALHNLGRYNEAIRTYRDHLIYQPYLPAIHNNLGQSLLAHGDSTGAEAAYRRGLEIFPAEPTLSNNLAVLYKERGDVALALKVYEEGKNAEGYHNLGLIKAQEGSFAEAEAAYREALNRAPTMVEVLYSLGGLYLLMDEFERSAEVFEAFLGKKPDNATLARRTKSRLLQLYPVLGDSYMRKGDFKAAEHAYDRLVDLGEGTAEVYGNLANIYGRRGEKSRSAAACRKAIDLDPEFAKAYFTLASLLDEAGASEEARTHYRNFLDRWEADDRFSRRASARLKALAAPQ